MKLDTDRRHRCPRPAARTHVRLGLKAGVAGCRDAHAVAHTGADAARLAPRD
jgi:hypothetical protein